MVYAWEHSYQECNVILFNILISNWLSYLFKLDLRILWYTGLLYWTHHVSVYSRHPEHPQSPWPQCEVSKISPKWSKYLMQCFWSWKTRVQIFSSTTDWYLLFQGILSSLLAEECCSSWAVGFFRVVFRMSLSLHIQSFFQGVAAALISFIIWKCISNRLAI